MIFARVITALCLIIGGGWMSPVYALDYEEYPSIRLRSLDKITARTLTFDAQVGSTVKFGDIYIKIQSCRKPPPVERNEASAFLQVWQVDKTKGDSHWIFSGWMFSSSPALSGMDHPVYDVWVIDCLGKDPESLPVEETQHDQALPSDGTVPEGSVPQPTVTPEQQEPVTENPVSEDTPDPMPKQENNKTPVPSAVNSSIEKTPVPKSPPKSPPADDSPTPSKETIDGIY